MAAKALRTAAEGHAYAATDCPTFVKRRVKARDGSLSYAGSNGIARNIARPTTRENATAAGRLAPGAGLIIRKGGAIGPPRSAGAIGCWISGLWASARA